MVRNAPGYGARAHEWEKTKTEVPARQSVQLTRRHVLAAASGWTLSAADEDQACAFRLQIDDRKKRNLIPLVPYHVFPDPPGPKIGSGGATLHILEHLHDIYGEEQARMRILLIHTGGQSKRLPSHSVLGKLFAQLPIASAAEFQMFDLKMAMYSPVPVPNEGWCVFDLLR
ncbi:hypothetical protein HPB48_007473 [Haemaphysalis longicornis]|uniref:GDP-fucose pyrophosphorylase domain-containing protein n=1 Tax=Haemaphysalis longicornis TaxID=44386 RepID=A0A9J6GEF2_HAELO|nr:hypothetical protein HPB48_007473 [Haemaphysalis longicornis]